MIIISARSLIETDQRDKRHRSVVIPFASFSSLSVGLLVFVTVVRVVVVLFAGMVATSVSWKVVNEAVVIVLALVSAAVISAGVVVAGVVIAAAVVIVNGCDVVVVVVV